MTRTMRRRHLIAPAAITAVIGVGGILAGCGSQASAGAAGGGSTAGAGATTPAAATRRLTITIKSDEQHAKKGSDGQYHDAFLPADFTVKPGQRVVVRFRNFDDMPHSFTSPGLPAGGAIPKGDLAIQPGLTTMPAAGLGLDAIVPGGTDAAPGTATVAFTAPAKTGRYFWFCKLPCDPWAMAHDGFMRGFVKVA